MQQEKDQPIPPTEAQKMQLCLDYFSAPEAYEVAQRFYGKYIDEIEQLDGVAQQVQQHEKKHQEMKRYYSNLDSVINAAEIKYIQKVDIQGYPLELKKFKECHLGNKHHLGGVALGAVYAEIRQHKQELHKTKEEMEESGEIISHAFSTYMQNRVSGYTKASLAGTTYEWDQGIAIRRSKQDKSDVWHLYCALPLHHEFAYKHRTGQLKNALYPRLANTKDWRHFVGNLSLLGTL